MMAGKLTELQTASGRPAWPRYAASARCGGVVSTTRREVGGRIRTLVLCV